MGLILKLASRTFIFYGRYVIWLKRLLVVPFEIVVLEESPPPPAGSSKKVVIDISKQKAAHLTL